MAPEVHKEDVNHFGAHYMANQGHVWTKPLRSSVLSCLLYFVYYFCTVGWEFVWMKQKLVDFFVLFFWKIL